MGTGSGTTVVSVGQGMLTPPRHMIPPLVYLEVCVCPILWFVFPTELMRLITVRYVYVISWKSKRVSREYRGYSISFKPRLLMTITVIYWRNSTPLLSFPMHLKVIFSPNRFQKWCIVFVINCLSLLKILYRQNTISIVENRGHNLSSWTKSLCLF
jgi:hypothetical protein